MSASLRRRTSGSEQQPLLDASHVSINSEDSQQQDAHRRTERPGGRGHLRRGLSERQVSMIAIGVSRCGPSLDV